MIDQHSSNGSFFTKIIEFFKFTSKPPKTIHQLLRLISQSETNAILPPDVFNMVNGVLQVSEMRVKDVMIPRSQMVYLDINQTTTEHLEIIIKSAHSRFPVVRNSKDKIVGVLLAKDLLHWSMRENNEEFKLGEMLRKAIFVPENKRLNVILQEFRNTRNHLAIVVDEYGHTSGMVTIEDVLEQIVGDITDEHDIEDNNLILRHSAVKYTVKAQTTMEDFNEYFGHNLVLNEVKTIGGFVVNSLGHLPKRNDVLETEQFRFKILRADKRRVHLLQVIVNKANVNKVN